MEIFAGLNDFTTSLQKALKETDENWQDYPGLVIAGTHAPSLIEGKLDKLKEARETGLPTLGVCFGMQLMAIEFARNVLGLKDANSTEIDQATNYPVVVKMPKLRVGIFKVRDRFESFWHNYKVSDDYLMLLTAAWTMDYSDDILAEMRLNNHPFYVGVQSHPEYGSSVSNPHPLLKEFIDACKRK